MAPSIDPRRATGADPEYAKASDGGLLIHTTDVMPQHKKKHDPGGGNLGSTLDEHINLDVLKRLKSAFHQADKDGGGDLDIEEFVAAFANVAKEHREGASLADEGGDPSSSASTEAEAENNDAKLRQLFTRIDANADGTVDWNEFSTYVLLENQGTAQMRETLQGSEYVEQQPPSLGGNEQPPDPLAKHKDLVTRIIHLPTRDSYVSTSRDGTVRMWSPHNGHALQRKTVVGSAYLTDCAMMPTSRRLAVACFNRRIRIFEPLDMHEVGIYVDLDSAPLCVNTWAGGRRVGPQGRDMDYMVVGDDGGYVHALRVIDKTDSEKTPGNLVRFEEMWKQKVHGDWVNRVMYLEGLDAVGSCSMDRNICITDIEQRAALRTLSGHAKGVHAMDWSPKYKFIASVGMDRNVLLWNPFSIKAIGQLTGHTSGLVDIIINEEEHQIISLGMDKCIKVWDIRNHKCLQTFFDRQAYRPENRLGSMLYDKKRRALVAASVQPKTWRLVSRDSTTAAGHTHPCVDAIFNPNYDQVVTADESGCVCVWNARTGAIDFRFTDAHKDNKLTAMAFDATGRRLITGCSDGTLRVWNYSNGHMLKELTSPTEDEVTAVVHTGASNHKRIAAVGWNRMLTFWDDDHLKSAPCSRQLKGHSADVLCLAQEAPTVLATGDFDGVIIVWNVESGAVRHRLTPPPPPAAGADADKYAPATDRAAESICFVSTKARGDRVPDMPKEFGAAPPPLVLAASYADGHVRLWNVTEGRCVGDFHAGHRAGEGVLSIASDPSGTRLVTGDSVGRIRLWDIGALMNGIVEDAAAGISGNDIFGRGDVELLGYWQAHKTGSCVNSVRFFTLDGAGAFFLTAAEDMDVHVWSDEGLHVGTYGRVKFDLKDESTWLSLEPPRGGDAYVQEKEAEEKERKAAKEVAEKRLREGGAASSAADTATTSTSAAAPVAPFSKGGPFSRRPGISPSPSSASDLYPEPSGYLPVRPVDDRKMWTDNIEESYENSDFFKKLEELKEKEDVSLDELKARHKRLHKKQPPMHRRVYVPEGDKHINHPKIPGRTNASLHHLVNIRDLKTLGPRPVSSRGKFQYGKPADLIDEEDAADSDAVGLGAGRVASGRPGGGRSAPAMAMASQVHGGMMGATGPGGSRRPATGRAARTEALAETMDVMAATPASKRPPTAEEAAAAGISRIASGRKTPSGSGKKPFVRAR